MFCLAQPECESRRLLLLRLSIWLMMGALSRFANRFTATNRSSFLLKTEAGCRDIDVSTEVAEYLRAFASGKNGLLFKTRNDTPQRWLTPRLQAMQVDGKGVGFHAIRRFRSTSRRQCPNCILAWTKNSN